MAERATLRTCEARNNERVRGSFATNTSGVRGGVVAAIRPASTAWSISRGETNVGESAHERIGGSTIKIPTATPTGQAIHHRPRRRPSHTNPRAASRGMQKANVRMRSGGYQVVRRPTGSATADSASHDTRKRRAYPRPWSAPITTRTVDMIGA
jgi:hypothetical protein